MSASDEYIAEVKTRILGMYKEMQAQNTTFDDRLSTCYQNVAKCVELFWQYRAVNPRISKGKEDWFDKDLAGWRVLQLIRDSVKPLLLAAEQDMGRFNAHVQTELVGLRAYVEAGWRPVKPEQREGPVLEEGRMEAIEHMQTLLRRMQELSGST